MFTITKDNVRYGFDTEKQMYTFIHYYISPDDKEKKLIEELYNQLTRQEKYIYKLEQQTLAEQDEIAKLHEHIKLRTKQMLERELENAKLKKKLEEARNLINSI